MSSDRSIPEPEAPVYHRRLPAPNEATFPGERHAQHPGVQTSTDSLSASSDHLALTLSTGYPSTDLPE